MKFNLFIFSLLFTGSLSAQEFKIIEATSQKWAGGQSRSGHGVNYRLTLVFNKKVKNLSIDSLSVGREFLQLKMIKNINIINENYFSKNDTIYLTARSRVKTNEYGDMIDGDDKLTNPLIDKQDKAFLSYHYKNKIKRLIINEFKVLKPQFYP